MNDTDKFGNNAMHKACRFRNPKMIELLLNEEVGDLQQRNLFGRLPLEMPHNDILNDKKIKACFEAHLLMHKNLVDKIQLRKEADYMFVVNLSRKEVLTDQLKAINNRY